MEIVGIALKNNIFHARKTKNIYVVYVLITHAFNKIKSCSVKQVYIKHVIYFYSGP